MRSVVTKGPESTTKMLLDAGIDPKQRGSLALTKAARSGRLSVVNMLLRRDFDPNETDVTLITALHKASKRGDVDIARTLLDAGANLRAMNRHDRDAFSLVVYYGHASLLSLLLERGISPKDPVLGAGVARASAAQRGHVDVMEIPFHAGADLQATDDRGWTALRHAATCGQLETVKLLLDRKAALDTRARLGHTELHCTCASLCSRKEVVELLLQQNVEVDARALDSGGTPLSMASAYGLRRQSARS